MAKKTKVKSKKTKDNSLNEKYNLVLRKIYSLAFQAQISNFCVDNNQELVFEVISSIKDIHYGMDKYGCEEFINPLYFMELLQYTEEILMLAYSGKRYVGDEVSYFRKQFVSKLKNDGVKYDFFVYASKVGKLLEAPELYPDGVEDLYADIARGITDMLFMFTQVITTYSCPFKNMQIDSFYLNEENHVDIKYNKLPMLLREQIEVLERGTNQETKIDDKYIGYMDKVSSQVHRAYSNFMSRDIDMEYYEEFKGYLKVTNKYKLPLFEDEEFLLSKSQLNELPFNRLYSVPATGVRFEFFNKECGIDHIDMKEDNKYINFNVYIINDEGLYTSRFTKDDIVGARRRELDEEESKFTQLTQIKDDIFKLSFCIKKQDLQNAEGLDKKLETLSSIGFTPYPSTITGAFFYNLRTVLFGCLYASYYKPTIFKDEFRLYNRTGSKGSGFTRDSSYRVEHLKKLPVGYKASDEALAYGRKEGFFIPDGYTFVRESNPQMKEESKSKIIKMK